MTRRTATFVFAAGILVTLVAVAALLPVPYVVYSPGPVENTLGEDDGEPVIQVEDAPTYPTTGMLDLTTVGVTPADQELDLVSALSAWLDPERAVLPRDVVYPEDITAEESREVNAVLLERSQESAKVAALRELDYEIPEVVVVDSVIDGTPAEGRLEPGDVVVAVDGSEVTEPQDVVDAVRMHEPGEEVEFVLMRDGERIVEVIETTEGDEGQAFVGFAPAPGYEFPVSIDVTIDDRIGGPSAGMIFALAIYDTLTPGALLDGLHIAGTGEITADGEVGAIGGIQQKIAAASNEGADIFLAPAGNCDEAVGSSNGDMQIVRVETLDDAVEAAETAAAGDLEELPACASS